MDASGSRYYLVNDVAKRRGVTPSAVRRDVERLRLRVAAKTMGGVKLFAPEDVERYLVECGSRRDAFGLIGTGRRRGGEGVG